MKNYKKPYNYKHFEHLSSKEKSSLSFLQKYDLQKLYDYEKSPILLINDLIYLNDLFQDIFFKKDISYLLSIADWQNEFFSLYPENSFHKIIEKENFYKAPYENIINTIENFLIFLEKFNNSDKRDFLFYSNELICSHLLNCAYLPSNKSHKKKILSTFYKTLKMSKELYTVSPMGFLTYHKLCFKILSSFSNYNKIGLSNKEYLFLIQEMSNCNRSDLVKDGFYLIERSMIYHNCFKNNSFISKDIINFLEIKLLCEKIEPLLNALPVNYHNKTYVDNLKLLCSLIFHKINENYNFNNFNNFNEQHFCTEEEKFLLAFLNHFDIKYLEKYVFFIPMPVLKKLLAKVKSNNKKLLLSIYEKRLIEQEVQGTIKQVKNIYKI